MTRALTGLKSVDTAPMNPCPAFATKPMAGERSRPCKRPRGYWGDEEYVWINGLRVTSFDTGNVGEVKAKWEASGVFKTMRGMFRLMGWE